MLATMTAGTYYIGDLCYVMHKEWDEFCSLTIDGNHCKEGKFELKDGREFVFFSTMYGDGVYHDGNGREYSVDAGLIGAIKLDHISEDDKKNVHLGNIVTFDANVECGSKNGILFFGSVIIHTEDDDEYDEYDGGYDDE